MRHIDVPHPRCIVRSPCTPLLDLECNESLTPSGGTDSEEYTIHSPPRTKRCRTTSEAMEEVLTPYGRRLFAPMTKCPTTLTPISIPPAWTCVVDGTDIVVGPRRFPFPESVFHPVPPTQYKTCSACSQRVSVTLLVQHRLSYCGGVCMSCVFMRFTENVQPSFAYDEHREPVLTCPRCNAAVLRLCLE